MLRFRNPGTQFSTQVQVIKLLYKNLGNRPFFTLEDMSNVIAHENLMTAYGYSGDNALKLSKNSNDSKNSALMNAKMYAEVFRMLGWITPIGEKSYPVIFTYIGVHIALSNEDCSKLYEQCVLGINNPTELTNKMTYTEEIRFFKCVLRSFIDLKGIMYKHEFCLGPMSTNDDESSYKKMITFINSLRGDIKKLSSNFTLLAKSLGMKETPVDNCTRLPIALLKACGFVESITNIDLYNKPLKCLKITEYGIDTYNKIKQMKDLRLKEFKSYDEDTKMALIRLGIYSMLKRADYDLSKIDNIIKNDTEKCKDILKGRELLFSPYQTIKHQLIEKALGFKINQNIICPNIYISSNTGTLRDKKNLFQSLDLNIPINIEESILKDKNNIYFLTKINKLKSQKMSSKKIVDCLFEEYKDSNKTNFYPLISTLFNIMGFKCYFSRPGDNGARWDAIIIDVNKSIPIEIKSPTEEIHLSIKAIRQALENKIVLLSRHTYKTNKNVTSLAIGYLMPNDRAEINRLILDIKETYNYKIGVIDFKSLLTIAISILVDNIGFDKDKLYSIEGFVNANISKEEKP